MSYLQVNTDGSASELGLIVGYQVRYMKGKKQQTSQNFNFLWQALGFQKTLKMGSSSQVVPIYQSVTIPQAT